MKEKKSTQISHEELGFFKGYIRKKLFVHVVVLYLEKGWENMNAQKNILKLLQTNNKEVFKETKPLIFFFKIYKRFQKFRTRSSRPNVL
jgi:hypothetical protein